MNLKKQEILKVNNHSDIPKNITGIVETADKTRYWLKEGLYHREDGPAIEGADGNKFWYVNGKSHRENGPAFEASDGSKEWWLNDKLHRLNGPAVENVNGLKKWIVEGKLHRLDGPAIEHSNGYKDWFIENIRYYSEKDYNLQIGLMNLKNKLEAETLIEKEKKILKVKNHFEVPNDYTGIAIFSDGVEFHYVNGKLHRENGPACEYPDGRKFYYLNGIMQNDPEQQKNPLKKNFDTEVVNYTDIPKGFSGIVKDVSGNLFWLKEGRLHREDGPSVECANGDRDWHIDGRFHKVDGPARIYANGTKRWFIEGVRYTEEQFNEKVQEMKAISSLIELKVNNYSDVPSNFTGIVLHQNIKHWYENGKFHRENYPAIEYPNGDKSWYVNGEKHRLDGPAIEWHNSSINNNRWYINGKCYSTEEEFNNKIDEINEEYNEKIKEMKSEKQAIVQPNEDKIDLEIQSIAKIPKDFTGITKNSTLGYKAWIENGEIHREDGPAIEWDFGRKEWCFNGKWHRLDGPAIENTTKFKQWFIHGKEFLEEDFNKKIKEMNNKNTTKEEDILRISDSRQPPYDYTGIAIDDEETKIYYVDGEYHRTDGPAIQYADGYKEWLMNGRFHRLDGPAIIESNGEKYWFINGFEYEKQEFHSILEKIKKEISLDKVLFVADSSEKIPHNFTGLVIDSYGTNEWYLNGEYHRENGPASEYPDGSKYWFLNGKRHRLDGPAAIKSNEKDEGPKYIKKYYINGKQYTKNEFNIEVQKHGKTMTLANFMPNIEPVKPSVDFSNESKLVLKRTAAKKITKIVSNIMASLITNTGTKKDSDKLKENLKKVLATEEGKSIVSILLGSVIPMVVAQFPQKYYSLISDMGQEFRVEGLSNFGVMLADFVTDKAFEPVKELLINALNDTDESSEKVRVDVTESKSINKSVLNENSEEQPESSKENKNILVQSVN